MVLELTAYVATHKSERIQVNARWPQNWWEAIKARFMPLWLRKWWRVRYERINVDEYKTTRICPHLPTDSNQRHIQFLVEPGDHDYEMSMQKVGFIEGARWWNAMKGCQAPTDNEEIKEEAKARYG